MHRQQCIVYCFGSKLILHLMWYDIVTSVKKQCTARKKVIWLQVPFSRCSEAFHCDAQSHSWDKSQNLHIHDNWDRKKKKILEHDWKLRNNHSMESEIAFSATVYLVNNELKVSTFNQTWKKKWIISSRPMVEGDELYSCHSPAHVVQLLIMQKVGR